MEWVISFLAAIRLFFSCSQEIQCLHANACWLTDTRAHTHVRSETRILTL